jgi:hypothetical protein
VLPDADDSTIVEIYSYKWERNPYFEILSKHKTVAHENIKLTRNQIFQAVAFMQRANTHIAEWEEKLNALRNDPHNPELRKYAKYEALLKHLKECQQKGFTGEDVMSLKVHNARRMTIDCKSPEGKQAMLKLLFQYSEMLKQEREDLREENEARARAGFGAELVENNEELDTQSAENNSQPENNNNEELDTQSAESTSNPGNNNNEESDNSHSNTSMQMR